VNYNPLFGGSYEALAADGAPGGYMPNAREYAEKDVKDLIDEGRGEIPFGDQSPGGDGSPSTADEEMRIVAGKGLRTDALRNLRIDAGTGVGGRVLATSRVMGVTDYIRSHPLPTTSTPYILEEGLRSLAAVRHNCGSHCAGSPLYRCARRSSSA